MYSIIQLTFGSALCIFLGGISAWAQVTGIPGQDVFVIPEAIQTTLTNTPTPSSTKFHSDNLSRPTPIFISSESPIATPTTTATPTNSGSLEISPDWPEYSLGSASGLGITQGTGMSKNFVSMTTDDQGYPVVAWPRITQDQESYVFVKQWTGEEWINVGCDPESWNSVGGSPWGVNRIFVDPNTNQLVLSMDFYRNFMLSFNGTQWKNWCGGGIDDSSGLEFFTDIAFLPDGNPVAFYYTGVGSSYEYFRVRKWNGTSWEEFSPGSATDYGIAGKFSREGGHPQIAIAKDGTIYCLWQHTVENHGALYIKKWDGFQWVECGAGSASDDGLNSGYTWITSRAMALDQEGLPWVVYTTDENQVQVKRFDGNSWISMWDAPLHDADDPNPPQYGLCDPGRTGGNPKIAMTAEDKPIVVWTDGETKVFYAEIWNGEQWIPAGRGADSGGGIGKGTNQDMTVSPAGEVIFAYEDDSTHEIYVRRYQPFSQVEPTTTPVVKPTAVPTFTPVPGGSGIVLLDGFGGIHSTDPNFHLPDLPYFPDDNIIRDLAPDPWGRGWYMLDGYGGIYRSSPDLPQPKGLPYFGFDIARRLVVRWTENGLQFYLLDGFGVVHTSDPAANFSNKFPAFESDRARDLDYDPVTNTWWLLDGNGLLYSDTGSVEFPLNTRWPWPNLIRSILFYQDHNSVLLDGFGGVHSYPKETAASLKSLIPSGFYFYGWDIVWDIEWIPNETSPN